MVMIGKLDDCFASAKMAQILKNTEFNQKFAQLPENRRSAICRNRFAKWLSHFAILQNQPATLRSRLAVLRKGAENLLKCANKSLVSKLGRHCCAA